MSAEPKLRLGPQATALLVLVASFHGLSPEEWMMRAIAEEGERIGVGGLAGVRTRFSGGEPVAGGRATRDEGARPPLSGRRCQS